MNEISIFVDESGGQNGHSKYYALTLVFHDQSNNIAKTLYEHERGLAIRGLANLPFHAGPILNGHDEYEGLDFKTRKSYFSLFFMDVQKMPIAYHTFVYKRNDVGDSAKLTARMKRDLISLFFDKLDYFQSFDKVKIYYDNGQEMVAHALHGAVEYAISKESILFRKTKASDFMLAQAADLFCTLEITALKYRNKEATNTDYKMFGSARDFKTNYMKAAKRKRLYRQS